MLKKKIRRGTSALGKDHQGPSDSCSLGRPQGSTTHGDSHEDLGLVPRVHHVPPVTGVPSRSTNTLKKPNRVFFVQVEQLNSYLKTLPCQYYSPKANQATKKVLPLDDADLATHLLRMCPAKWQTQHYLTEKTTPVSTRALLLVLENIENNAEFDAKPSSMTEAKGADQKRKMESIDSCIPKKPKKVGWTDKHCVLCKKHGGYTKVTTPVTAAVISKTVLKSRRMGAQVSPIQKKGSQRVQTLPR
eukprot:CCRYP_014981-RA/>CCRYP_014981-RA protein AED:0.99 eAED:1.00 QI:0/-1/0/1/-1/1/1/0/244